MGIQNRNGALFLATGIDNSGLYSGLNQAEGRIDQFEAHIKRMGDNITRMTGIGFGVAGLKAFGSEIINVRGEMQMLESSFEVLLGGKGVSGFMSEMKQFAVDSPLSMNGVANAAQTLLGFGIAAEKVMPTIKQIGDISMGNEERFKSLSLAFAQMSATGKLMGQDLLQMINAGFNPLQTISEKTGKSIGDLKKEMEGGSISSQMVADAFASATAEGGKFYGMTQKQAEGIKGLQAQLEGGLIDAFNKVGQSQEGLIAGGYKVSIALVENYQTVGEALTALIATYGVYKAAMVFNTSIDKTVTVMRYEAEIAELTKLLPLKEQEANADLKTAVASGKLTEEKAKQLIALRAEIESRRESIQSKLAEEQINLKSLEAKRLEAVEAIKLAQAKTAAAKEELANAIATAEGEKIASLQKKMGIESERQSRAALRIVKLQDQKDAAIEQARALKESQASAEKVAAKNREIASIHAKILAAREEEIQHGRNVAAIRSEIKAGVDVTANKNIQTLTNKVNTLSEKENAAATIQTGYAKQIVGKRVLIKKLATDAETISTQINTAEQNINTVSTNILAVAKNRAAAAAKKLWAALAPNPYILAAAAVVALGYGVYKLATHMTDADKAQGRLNEAMRESEKGAIGETRELAKLKGELSAAKKGTDEYKKIKDDIIKKYGQYYSGLEKEIEKVGLLEGTYNKLTQAIQKSFSARQYDKFAKQEQDNLDDVMSENLGNIQDRLVEKLGEEAGNKYYSKIRKAILDGNLKAGKTFTDVDGLDRATQYALDRVSGEASGDLTRNYAIEGYIRNILTAQKLTDDLDKKAKVKFGIDDVVDSSDTGSQTKDPIKTLAEQTDDARQKVAKLKTDLADLRSGKTVSSNYSDDIEKKAKELKDAEDKLSFLLNGKSSSSYDKDSRSGESAAQKAHRQAQEVADQQDKINQLVAKQSVERKRLDEDLANQEAQARINAMQSGAEKTRAQQDLNDKLELQALVRQKEDYIREYIQAQKEIFDAQQELELKKNPKYTKKVFDSSSVKPDTSLFDSIIGEVNTSKLNRGFDEIDKSWNDYFIKFGNYQEKRKAIIEKYNREIAEAQTGGDKAILQKEMQNQLDELDNSVRNSATLMGQLFADSSRKSVNEIQAIIDKAELLMQYLQAVKDQQGNATINGKAVSKQDILGLGISENTLQNLQLSAEEIEALRNAINKLKGDLGEKSPFKLFESQIGDATKKIKQGGKNNIAQGITEISSSISQFAPDVKEFGNSLGTLFGDDEMGKNIGLVVDGIEGIGTAAGGVAKIMSGDVIGGVMDVVNGVAQAVNAFGSLFGPDGTAYYEAIRSQLEAINNVYASLIEKSKEEIVFGGGFASITAANSALDNYYKKVANLQRIADASGRSGAKWNSHSAEWHSNKNVGANNFSQMSAIIGKSIQSMDDLYYLSGEELYLIKSQMPEAWSLIDSRILENLDSIVACKDEALELKDALNEALTGISQDAFYNDFINNLSDMEMSFEDMCDNFEDYLRKSIIAGLVSSKYKDRINSLYQSWSDAAKSDNKITESEAERLKKEYQDIVQQMAKDRQNLADSFGWESDDTVDATSKGIASMSQDSANELNGNFFALLQKTGDIRNINEASRLLLGGINNGVSDIQSIMKENNQVFRDSLEIYTKIEANTRKAADILDRLNTLGITIRN